MFFSFPYPSHAPRGSTSRPLQRSLIWTQSVPKEFRMQSVGTIKMDAGASSKSSHRFFIAPVLIFSGEKYHPNLSLRRRAASEAICNGIRLDSPPIVIPANAGIQFFWFPGPRIEPGVTEIESLYCSHAPRGSIPRPLLRSLNGSSAVLCNLVDCWAIHGRGYWLSLCFCRFYP